MHGFLHIRVMHIHARKICGSDEIFQLTIVVAVVLYVVVLFLSMLFFAEIKKYGVPTL